MSHSPAEATNLDEYDMFFEWPSSEPREVIVTGTFDKWSRSKSLNKTARGFVGTVRVPWGEKVKYKFVVDGRWTTVKGQPTETDPGGYLNNVFTTPPKPAVSEAAQPLVEEKAGPVIKEVQTPPTPPAEVDDAKKELALPSEVETPIVDPPAGLTSKTSRVPLVFVSLNSTEHNTVGSTPLPSLPDYVLPPSNRASGTTTSPAPSPQPPSVAPVQEAITVPGESVAESHTVESSPVSEDHALEAKNEPALEQPTKLPTEEVTPEPKQEAPVEPSAPEIPAPEEAPVPTVISPPAAPIAEAITKALSSPVLSVDSDAQKAELAVKETAAFSPGVKTGQKAQEVPVPAALPTPPSTPNNRKIFPRAVSPTSISSQGSPSKTDTFSSSRKKRRSIFGKLKDIFHHDKEKSVEKSKN